MSEEIANGNEANAVATTDTETENILAAAKEDAFDKFLKFKKGDYFIGEDKIPLGTMYLAHCVGWIKAWIKFDDKQVLEKKYIASRAASVRLIATIWMRSTK